MDGVFIYGADADRPVQHVVHDGLVLVQRVHVQVQDGDKAAVQRRKQQRSGFARVLHDAGQEAATHRVVGRCRRPAGRAHIRVARQRVVLHTADGQPGRHLARVGQRTADREPVPVSRHRTPHLHRGQLPGERRAAMSSTGGIGYTAGSFGSPFPYFPFPCLLVTENRLFPRRTVSDRYRL